MDKDTLAHFLNDSRYTIRERDYAHSNEPENKFEPVKIDDMYSDYLIFCGNEQYKPLTRVQVVERLKNGDFNKLSISGDSVIGLRLVMTNDERTSAAFPVVGIKARLRRFLEKTTELTGMSSDYVKRSEIYDLFVLESGLSPTRQSFYKAMMELDLKAVRYPISAGFTENGTHCFRGLRLRDDLL